MPANQPTEIARSSAFGDKMIIHPPTILTKARISMQRAIRDASEFGLYESILPILNLPVLAATQAYQGHRVYHLGPQARLTATINLQKRDADLVTDATYRPSGNSSESQRIENEARARAQVSLHRGAADSSARRNVKSSPAEHTQDSVCKSLRVKTQEPLKTDDGAAPGIKSNNVSSVGDETDNEDETDDEGDDGDSSGDSDEDGHGYRTRSAARDAVKPISQASSSDSSISQHESCRITDFSVTMSILNQEYPEAEDKNYILSVHEVKVVQVKFDARTSMDQLARTMLRKVIYNTMDSALPQVIRQVQFALEKSPDQEAIYAVIMVNDQFRVLYFERSQVPRLDLDAFGPADQGYYPPKAKTGAVTQALLALSTWTEAPSIYITCAYNLKPGVKYSAKFEQWWQGLLAYSQDENIFPHRKHNPTKKPAPTTVDKRSKAAGKKRAKASEKK